MAIEILPEEVIAKKSDNADQVDSKQSKRKEIEDLEFKLMLDRLASGADYFELSV